jgi:uncharacterized membrane protein YgcG
LVSLPTYFSLRFPGNWKPIIPPVKAHKAVVAQSIIEPQPLLYHQDSHPAQFHVTIERFPGPDESHSPSKVTFASGPSASSFWGGDDSGSSSGSSESSEEQGGGGGGGSGGGGNFFHGKSV